MPRSSDFQKIHARFVAQYGERKGEDLYNAWVSKKGYKEENPLPGKERKEKVCVVHGVELKEIAGTYYLDGLIATSHIDAVGDRIPKETLESFAQQINTKFEARIMGLHHSEGKTGEYCGIADVESNPAHVVSLSDGEYGLRVTTKLLGGDPQTKEVVAGYEKGDLVGFSITYDTDGFQTADFIWENDEMVRVLNPDTRLFGYTAASHPVQEAAVVTAFGYKEFKELITLTAPSAGNEASSEEKPMTTEAKEIENPAPPVESKEDIVESKDVKVEEESAEMKEFREYKKNKNEIAAKVLREVDGKMTNEIKEKVLSQEATQLSSASVKEVPLEVKEFIEIAKRPELEIKEQFRRASALVTDEMWSKGTQRAEKREYKHFGTNGRNLEYKGLGITTNQNADTDYLQSAAELQDVYDPVIYNALNQATVTWNVLAKDDFSKKGNNQVQFTLKTASNASAAFYTGNAVSTGNVTRLKYQTKFKKAQVGVSVDGDMIAAARGGPIGDVLAQEVLDSTMDLLAVINVALYAEVGAETAAGPIGFEYLTDSAGNATLYSLTRSAANKLSPDSAGDTYINGSSAIVSMGNLRAAIKQCTVDGSKKSDLCFFTNPVQGNLLRGKFDESRRLLSARDTRFGFETDLFIDGVPVFEDKDCNTDDWFLVDLSAHRVAIWVPPTIEKLGKTGDSEEAFIKTYFAVYNRAPRRIVQIYGNATS